MLSRRKLITGAAALAAYSQIEDAVAQPMRELLFGRASSNVVPAGPAAAAALALLPASITTTTRNKLVTAINSLAAGGWWSKMDFFHLYAADNTPNSAVDLTGNGFTSGFGATMTLLPRVGYYGNGSDSSGVINTNFIPATNGSNYKLNSCSLGVGIVNNRTTADTSVVMGSVNSSSAYDQIAPLYTGNIGIGTLGSSSGSAQGTTSGTRGVWTVSRTASNAFSLYQNGSVVASASNASVSLTTNKIIVCGRWINVSTPGNYSNDVVAFDFAGSGFSNADVVGINSALQPLLAAAVPSIAAAWGFTNNALNYTPSGLSDIDLSLTNNPGFNLYMTPFWGVGAPNPMADLSYASGILTNQASVNAQFYRSRVSTRGNSSSTFTGSVSGTTLTVSAMIGVNAGGYGGTSYTNPVAAGQKLGGAGFGTQPLSGPTILQQLTGTSGGAGTYQLDTNMGTIASETMNGYSSVGAIPPFKAGGFFDFRAAFNPALSPATPTNQAYPLMQLVGLNSLFGRQFINTAASTQMRGAEIDLLEVNPTSVAGSPQYLMGSHDEQVPSNYADWLYTNELSSVVSTAALGNPTFTNPHHYQVLWVPASLNGGVGLIWRFFDGVRVNGLDITYSSSGPATGTWQSAGGQVIANFNGNMSIADSDQMVLQFDGGYGQALNVYSISVMQAP